jgi:hypothetical protein|tara:strand:+ start:866 stop:1036 length:171 start_codon:yes stop_codon:yes gene_type:complete
MNVKPSNQYDDEFMEFWGIEHKTYKVVSEYWSNGESRFIMDDGNDWPSVFFHEGML